MSKKYLSHTSGRTKDKLDVSDVVVSKYFEDNIYRKNKRFESLLFVVSNDSDIDYFIKGLTVEGLRLQCFYFSAYLMESSTPRELLVSILKSLISNKITQFNTRVSYGKKDGLTGYELISYIKRKI